MGARERSRTARASGARPGSEPTSPDECTTLMATPASEANSKRRPTLISDRLRRSPDPGHHPRGCARRRGSGRQPRHLVACRRARSATGATPRLRWMMSIRQFGHAVRRGCSLTLNDRPCMFGASGNGRTPRGAATSYPGCLTEDVQDGRREICQRELVLDGHSHDRVVRSRRCAADRQGQHNRAPRTTSPGDAALELDGRGSGQGGEPRTSRPRGSPCRRGRTVPAG